MRQEPFFVMRFALSCILVLIYFGTLSAKAFKVSVFENGV
jgi:hypothetical protein